MDLARLVFWWRTFTGERGWEVQKSVFFFCFGSTRIDRLRYREYRTMTLLKIKRLPS